jgi:hypothetical protein
LATERRLRRRRNWPLIHLAKMNEFMAMKMYLQVTFVEVDPAIRRAALSIVEVLV